MIVCIHCASLLFASTPCLEKTEEPNYHGNASCEITQSTECSEDLCRGLIFLIQQNPIAALNALESAEVHRPQSFLQNDFNPIIAFCRAIAYDQSGSRDLALQALDFLNNALIEENGPGEEEEIEMADPEPEEASEFLHRLAALAPSADIEQTLHLIVEQICGKIPPLILFESKCWMADGERAVKHGGYSKFIRRWTHILKRVAQLFELVKNIEQIIENGKGLIKE